MSSEFRTLVLSLPEEHDSLSAVFEQHLGLNRIDARIRIHNLPGVLPPLPDEDSAKKLAAAIHDCGGYAVAIPAENVPQLEHPQPIHHARCVDGGLEILGLAGEIEETWPWDDFALMSIGSVFLERSHRESADTTALHSAPGTKGIRLDLDSMRGPEVWLIAENPFRRRLIKHTEMNYEYLGERKSTSAAANFRLFVDDVISQAPNLYLTPAARAFTGHGLFQHYAFDSEDALREHTLLHLSIRRQMRGDPAAP